MDFSAAGMQTLLRQFARGNVVLFAGAGFSIGAQNAEGSEPPPGDTLSKRLAQECGWSYAGEELPLVYEQAAKHLGTKALRDFLDRLYGGCHPASWHRTVSTVHWHRLYTTNIDDLIESAYAGSGCQTLKSIVCPTPFQDPDPFLGAVQCVHLHGSVSDRSKPLTFTASDFAAASASPSPWYQTLIDDMYSKSVLFIGTRLSEPPFHHYLQLRGVREKGTPEARAKAFVVTPNPTQLRIRQFEDQNMVVIPETAEEFLPALAAEVSKRVPSTQHLLATKYPHQLHVLTGDKVASRMELLRDFDLVVASPPTREGGPSAERTLFFLGAEPTWDDIRSNVDAVRTFTYEFLDTLRGAREGLNALLITGHAGSGKSTLLRRLAIELAREGRTVYYAKAPRAVAASAVLSLLAGLDGKHVYLFVDDAYYQLDSIAKILRDVGDDVNVTLVLAERPHLIEARLDRLPIKLTGLLDIPGLNRSDCELVIEKLGESGFLGALQGKSRDEQLRVFLGRSQKQLLVAMKEATSGQGFDVIIGNEFRTLANDEARFAYIVACLCYMHGAPVRRKHLLACLDGTDVEKAAVLSRHLREVLVPWKDNSEFLSPRHRVIARQVIAEAVPLADKLAAATAYVIQISGDVMPETISKRTAEYRGYRGVINFDNIKFLLDEHYDSIGAFFKEIRPYFEWDFLFWLQWGRAEIHFDHFDVAENHLNQSLGIRDERNFQARHHKGVLFLKRACQEESAGIAAEYAGQGEEYLRRELSQRGAQDAYPAAALITHKLRYLLKWRPPNFGEAMQELYELGTQARRSHPLNAALEEAFTELFRHYLLLAVPDNADRSRPG